MRRRALRNRVEQHTTSWHGPGELELALVRGTNKLLQPAGGLTGAPRYRDLDTTMSSRVFPAFQNFTTAVKTNHTTRYGDAQAIDAFPSTSTPNNPTMATLAAMARY